MHSVFKLIGKDHIPKFRLFNKKIVNLYEDFLFSLGSTYLRHKLGNLSQHLKMLSKGTTWLTWLYLSRPLLLTLALLSRLGCCSTRHSVGAWGFPFQHFTTKKNRPPTGTKVNEVRAAPLTFDWCLISSIVVPTRRVNINYAKRGSDRWFSKWGTRKCHFAMPEKALLAI